MIELGELEASVRLAKSLPTFSMADQWWLTFCISGPEDCLQVVARTLAKEHGENLSGTETGFLNAKLWVPSDAHSIAQIAARVFALATSCGAVLVAVDADTSSEVEGSEFYQLWAAQPAL